jgi:pimeloyl-ACP methyl ester carboxylesterase
MPSIVFDGLTSGYEECGDGPAVVFLHGLGLDRSSWAPCVSTLRGSFRCVALDLLGHGGSSAPPAGYDLDLEARRVLAVLDALSIPSAHMVGLSLGAMVAMRCALMAPRAVRSLVLISVSADRAHTPAGRRPGMSHAELVFSEGFRERAPASVAAYLDRPVNTDVARVVQGAVSTRRSILGRLGEIGVPTLLIAGEADVAIDPAQSALARDAIPGAKLLMVPGAGHMVVLERPDVVTAAIAGFLAGGSDA